jgi:regulator of RNase E activity RraB
VLEDARWDFYRDTLYPEPEDTLWMQDRQLVEELASEGDAIDRAREVDHFVVFKDTRQRKKFVTQAVRLGYTVGELTDDDADESDPSYEVRLIRTHPVTLEAVSPITRELARLAWKFRGEYDGWGCMSMLGKSPKKKPVK